MRLLLLALLTLSPAGASAQIYKCTNDKGKTEFNDRPCGSDSQKIELKSDSAGISVGPQGDFSKMRDGNQARGLERKIQVKRGEIRALENERDHKLAQLRARKTHAMNNLAGATWQESISTEMNAVVDQYSSKISMRRDEMKDLQEQLRQVGEK